MVTLQESIDEKYGEKESEAEDFGFIVFVSNSPEAKFLTREGLLCKVEEIFRARNKNEYKGRINVKEIHRACHHSVKLKSKERDRFVRR